MNPARTYPTRRDDVRLLLLDSTDGSLLETRTTVLPRLLRRGDLLVLNDAATLPAALHGHDEERHPVEARLISTDPNGRFGQFLAILFGEGDWRERTEDRPGPPPLATGARLRFGDLEAELVSHSPLSRRLVSLRFLGEPDAVWAGIYRQGRPVQYSYLANDLPLWAVQNVFAARPWAFEMPSAGRPLSWEILLALKREGVGTAFLTHAAGLSSTGDPALDALLPLPEQFEIPASTVEAIAATHRQGGLVIAVGTTVVRALEGSFVQHGKLQAGRDVTDLRIDSTHRLQVVDGILSGIHTPNESHFDLLSAFASKEHLASAAAYADMAGFTNHELGDSMLIVPRRAPERRQFISESSSHHSLTASCNNWRAQTGPVGSTR